MAHEYLLGHRVNACNEALTIRVEGPAYVIGARDPASGLYGASFMPDGSPVVIQFHEGALDADGNPNGVTVEALLAVLVHRMQGYQASPFACRENALALTKMQEAGMWLRARTESRQARGIEGTQRV